MLVNTLPKELAQVAPDKIKRVMKGENIIDMQKPRFRDVAAREKE